MHHHSTTYSTKQRAKLAATDILDATRAASEMTIESWLKVPSLPAADKLANH